MMFSEHSMSTLLLSFCCPFVAVLLLIACCCVRMFLFLVLLSFICSFSRLFVPFHFVESLLFLLPKVDWVQSDLGPWNCLGELASGHSVLSLWDQLWILLVIWYPLQPLADLNETICEWYHPTFPMCKFVSREAIIMIIMVIRKHKTNKHTTT